VLPLSCGLARQGEIGYGIRVDMSGGFEWSQQRAVSTEVGIGVAAPLTWIGQKPDSPLRLLTTPFVGLVMAQREEVAGGRSETARACAATVGLANRVEAEIGSWTFGYGHSLAYYQNPGSFPSSDVFYKTKELVMTNGAKLGFRVGRGMVIDFHFVDTRYLQGNAFCSWYDTVGLGASWALAPAKSQNLLLRASLDLDFGALYRGYNLNLGLRYTF